MNEVVVAALVREGQVLLVHRSSNRRAYPDVWDLPGGHVETGETELAALTREMHEELGVQIAGGSAIHLCRLDMGRGGESVRLSAWLVGAWQGTPTNVAPDEHDVIRWFRPEELPPFAHEHLSTALLDALRAPAPRTRSHKDRATSTRGYDAAGERRRPAVHAKSSGRISGCLAPSQAAQRPSW